MKNYKKVLTIAGSDSGGGAGIQADIKTISACGCYAASAITAVTVQNTTGVKDFLPLSPEIVGEQIAAVMEDIGADAVKIGMLGSSEIVRAVKAELVRFKAENIVLDPVLVATSGDALAADNVVEAIISDLMPLAKVITPNIPEAEALTGIKIETSSDFTAVWENLAYRGAQALLLKGGHAHDDMIEDFLFTRDSVHVFTNNRIYSSNTHGTGCTLSSAIASFLAKGLPLNEAVKEAIGYVHQAILAGSEYKLGNGSGPVHHFFQWWE